MGTTLAHMLRADTATGDAADAGTGGPVIHRSPDRSPEDQGQHARDQTTGAGTAAAASRPPAVVRNPPRRDHDAAQQTTGPGPRTAQPQTVQAHLIARRLAATGKPVSRRALRSGGVKGSNESLNALARKVNAELAGVAVLARSDGETLPTSDRIRCQ